MSESEFACPRCTLALQQMKMSHGVLWACHKCGGRAVGLELLRRTFTPESINPLWLHAIRSQGQSSCRCPSCRNPMIEVNLSDTPGVKVDVCRICHFVWFDAHEVDTLVPRQLPDEVKRVPDKARQAVAMAKVQQLAKQARDVEFETGSSVGMWSAIAEFFEI